MHGVLINRIIGLRKCSLQNSFCNMCKAQLSGLGHFSFTDISWNKGLFFIILILVIHLMFFFSALSDHQFKYCHDIFDHLLI